MASIHPPDLGILALKRRIDKAQRLLERMCRRIERAARAEDGADPQLFQQAAALWGPKDNASTALAKLQQMQTRWAELELDLLRLEIGRAPQGDDVHQALPIDLDLDLLEGEISRLRGASDAGASAERAGEAD